jgi:hypothetical protein
MSVPLLDLKAQFVPLRDEILAAIARVCDSQRFILGPEGEALEKELAAIIGVEHAIGVSSGTDALIVSMMALGIGPGDEVITSTPPFRDPGLDACWTPVLPTRSQTPTRSRPSLAVTPRTRHRRCLHSCARHGSYPKSRGSTTRHPRTPGD